MTISLKMLTMQPLLTGQVAMPYWAKQPGFCCVCGERGKFEPHARMGFIHDSCITEYRWRETLYILGKPYYPQQDTTNPRGDDAHGGAVPDQAHR